MNEIMDAAINQPAATPQTITLKEGCRVKTGSGFRRMRRRIETEATPILSGDGEVVGFRFQNLLYRGVSHDLEKIIVEDKKEK